MGWFAAFSSAQNLTMLYTIDLVDAINVLPILDMFCVFLDMFIQKITNKTTRETFPAYNTYNQYQTQSNKQLLQDSQVKLSQQKQSQTDWDQCCQQRKAWCSYFTQTISINYCGTKGTSHLTAKWILGS